MAGLPADWIGSAYLFFQSRLIDLAELFKNQKQLVYRVFSSSISESSDGCRGSIDILKIHSSETNLILYLKFCGRETCRRFLQDYKEGRVRQRIQNKLQNGLLNASVQMTMQLKVDSVTLDEILDKEEACLEHIGSMKPSYQKDDELVELDRLFTNMTLGPSASPSTISNTENSTLTSLSHTLHSTGSLPSETSTFQFQDQEYVDQPLTREHQLRFAKLVGNKWKKVGRTLSKTCRALKDPAIDNLAYDYGKDGLYEQAYQLLQQFIMGEGKKATIKRLVDALVDNELTSVAEALLTENPNGLD
uniref:Tumor necrosis factor receptor type 1-associated DEATH domain protein n=1 Tax=Leptobrachium leishanense TaxID=445787 RepID=A0A8C5PXL0_9ANUR